MNMEIVLLFVCLLGAFMVQHVAETKGLGSKHLRIINGTDKGYNRPYYAQVTLLDYNICGGTIISDRAVLTAAQCLYSTILSDYKVYVGSNVNKKGDPYKILNSIIHPKYDVLTQVNDIGILITETALKLKKGKIEQLPLFSTDTKVKEGTTVLIMGFGSKTDDRGYITHKLFQAVVRVRFNGRCQKIIRGLTVRPGKITENQFCTVVGADKKDACQLDQGGPVVLNNKLFGIISWGIGCGYKGFPRIHTYVSKYLPWINANIIPKERTKQCTGSKDLTEEHTLFIIHGNSTICTCTILTTQSCLTFGMCIPYNENLNDYQILHSKKIYKITSTVTGYTINKMWTLKDYDFMIVKFDLIKYDAKFGPPMIFSDDELKMSFVDGILVKNHYYEISTAPGDLYLESEQVEILDYNTCQIKYPDLKDLVLTPNHFCVTKNCEPSATRRQICSDMRGSVVYRMYHKTDTLIKLIEYEELIGLIVYEETCHTHAMAVGVYLGKYYQNLK